VLFRSVYYLTRVVRKGMYGDMLEVHDVERAMRPMSAAHVSFDDDDTAPTRS